MIRRAAQIKKGFSGGGSVDVDVRGMYWGFGGGRGDGICLRPFLLSFFLSNLFGQKKSKLGKWQPPSIYHAKDLVHPTATL